MANDSSRVDNSTWAQAILIGRNPKWTLARIAVLVIASVVVFNFVLLPIRVKGISMLPTYKENGINFVNRLAYWSRHPQRGDVVAIRYAGKHVMLMKRIIGLPGETIAFRGGRVLIDGEWLEEPYLKLPSQWTLSPETIGPGQYYVVGDNRSMRAEDHEKGKAERSRIVGKVLLQ